MKRAILILSLWLGVVGFALAQSDPWVLQREFNNLVIGHFSSQSEPLLGSGGIIRQPGNLTSGLTAGSVIFYNGSALTQDNPNFFWDDTNNRLGIGTTTPGSTLSVQGGNLQVTGTTTTSALVATSTLFVGNIGQNLIVNSAGRVGVGTTSPGSLLSVQGGDLQVTGVATVGSLFSTSTLQVGSINSPTLITDAAGNVGIGTTTPGSLFSVRGIANFEPTPNATSTIYTPVVLPGLNATGSVVMLSGITTLSGVGDVACVLATGQIVKDDSPLTACSGASSQTVKHDITQLTDSLADILAMRPVSYVYNKEYKPNDQTTHLGLIAEEVLDQRLIEKDGSIPGIKYVEIIPKLIGAIQEVVAKITGLEDRLNSLEKRIIELESK